MPLSMLTCPSPYIPMPPIPPKICILPCGAALYSWAARAPSSSTTAYTTWSSPSRVLAMVPMPPLPMLPLPMPPLTCHQHASPLPLSHVVSLHAPLVRPPVGLLLTMPWHTGDIYPISEVPRLLLLPLLPSWLCSTASPALSADSMPCLCAVDALLMPCRCPVDALLMPWCCSLPVFSWASLSSQWASSSSPPSPPSACPL